MKTQISGWIGVGASQQIRHDDLRHFDLPRAHRRLPRLDADDPLGTEDTGSSMDGRHYGAVRRPEGGLAGVLLLL